MGTEIERKFLVTGQGYRSAEGTQCRQGYIPTQKGSTIRVRTAGGIGYITIKGTAAGISRKEFEYRIPFADAEEMMASLCAGSIIEKVRFRVTHHGLTWEIDEFMGENEGLVVAEVELEREDQAISRPSWVGEEVSHDPRYSNASLSRNPYKLWKT